MTNQDPHAALVKLFLPFVKARIDVNMLLEDYKNCLAENEPALVELANLVNTAEGKSKLLELLDEVDELSTEEKLRIPDKIEELHKAVETQQSMSSDEFQNELDDLATEDAHIFVTSWVQLLCAVVREKSDYYNKALSLKDAAMIDDMRVGVLELKTLDDAMLPPLPWSSKGRVWEQCFADGCNQMHCSIATVEAAREILRAVKKSLPEGKVIPDEAVEMLKSIGVDVK